MLKYKILVVDDEYANRFLMETILEEYDVFSADSAKQMWTLLNESLPDLILLDVMMPYEDGFQIAEKLSKNENYKSIPIVFVSARDNILDIEKGIQAGGADYITKPFSHDDIKDRIKNVLEQSKP